MEESINELKNRFNSNLELIETKFKMNNKQIKDYVERQQEENVKFIREQTEIMKNTIWVFFKVNLILNAP